MGKPPVVRSPYPPQLVDIKSSSDWSSNERHSSENGIRVQWTNMRKCLEWQTKGVQFSPTPRPQKITARLQNTEYVWITRVLDFAHNNMNRYQNWKTSPLDYLSKPSALLITYQFVWETQHARDMTCLRAEAFCIQRFFRVDYLHT